METKKSNENEIDIFSDVLDNAEKNLINTTKEIFETDGQRSVAWFENRKGKFTGSKLKDLMAKGRGSNPYGEKAKHYIFSRFMERLRGTPDTPIYPTFAMKRGIELEPYAIASFEERYKNEIRVEEVDFILFPDCETAGASPDGLVYENKTNKLLGVFETKSRGEEGTYTHAFDRVNEKHPEFWQLQGEMLATNTDVAFYCHYTDTQPKPFDLQVQLVKRSPDHIIKLMERIKDADNVIDAALSIVGVVDDLTPNELTEKIINAREFIYSR